MTTEEAAMQPLKIYTPEYYARIRALEDRHWWYAGMRAIAAALLRSERPQDRPGRFLDAGCGTGAAMAWARSVARAGSVAGIDVSAYALAFCRERGERALSQASVMELPFRNASFDVVLCNDVLQHLPTDGGDLRALEEIHRVLGPGGALLVRTNSALGIPHGERTDHDFQRYRLDGVAARMQSAGFVVKRASYVNALPAVYATFKSRLRPPRHSGHHAHGHESTSAYQGLGVRENIANRPLLNRALTWILSQEARYLARPGRRLPFGHTIVCLAVKSH